MNNRFDNGDYKFGLGMAGVLLATALTLTFCTEAAPQDTPSPDRQQNENIQSNNQSKAVLEAPELNRIF